MKTFDGYSKEKFSDTSVLLAGGGSKELSNFIGTLNWDSTNRKLQYKKIGDTNWNDLVTFGSNATNSTAYLPLAGGIMTGSITMNGMNTNLNWNVDYLNRWAKEFIVYNQHNSSSGNLVNVFHLGGYGNTNGFEYAYIGTASYDGNNLRFNKDGTITIGSGTIWHSNNDGSGSGLDADLLDGQELMTIVSDWNTNSLSIFKSSENFISNAPTIDYVYGVTLRFHKLTDKYNTDLVASLYYDRLFFRRKTEKGYLTWREIIHSGNITNYYWANINISSSSRTTTTPTFATATATTSVTTPLVSSAGNLILNATSDTLLLKFNNDDTKSVLLDGIAFRSFEAANNKLTLGSASARWSNVYSYLGNFKSAVHIYADSSSNYTEGIRLYGTAKDSTWSIINFGCDPTTNSGTHENQWLVGRDSSNRLVFRNNTTDLMYLTTNGLGIGVVPTLKLHVNGNAIATNFGVNSSGGGNGISLFSGTDYVALYGIAFNQTSNWGIHGYVTSDWATYFTMNNLNNRGWIFRRNESGNVFSIDTSGLVYANGIINGNYFNSHVATGTLPYACTSTTLNTNLNADLLDGYHATMGSTKPWRSIPAIGIDGVIDLGRYIDWHYDNTTGSDYSTRLHVSGNHNNVVELPSTSGILALTSQIPTNYLPRYTYTVPKEKSLRITFAGAFNAIIYGRCTLGNGSLILIGNGYGENRIRNNWTQLSNGSISWSVPASDSYYNTIEIQGKSTHPISIEVLSKVTPTFTEIATLTSSIMDDPVALKSLIPTKTSQLTNNSGYLTSLPSHNHGYIVSNSTSKVGGLTYYTAQRVSETLADGNSWCKPAGIDYDGNSMILRMRWGSGTYGHDIFASPNTLTLWHRNISNNTNTWKEILDSSNYTSYALPLSGGTCTGDIYAPHFYESSDIRYKKILRNLLITSNTIANLPLFDFEWIENNSIGTGTSAQAVKEILPNLVSGTDKLTLDYGVLGTIAGITACKELVNLKSEIDLLKERIKELELQLKIINDY